jgi:hypothetical protein
MVHSPSEHSRRSRSSYHKIAGATKMCFTIGWVEQLCIWLIIVFAVFAIIRAVLPMLTGMIGIPIVVTIINIVLWAVLAILCVKIIFMLFACLLSGPGVAMLR